MKIGIDIMGGDFAPEATVLGAIQAQKKLASTTELLLIGDENKIIKILEREKVDPSLFTIFHSSEVIEMDDHPAKAFAKKTHSSISIGFNLLKTGRIDGFASAGNTGAMLVGIHYSVKTIPGVIRPAIGAFIPNETDVPTLILDVGLNPDTKPDVLYQYGIMGSIYVKKVLKKTNPRVALLNIGNEESKGNLAVRSAYELMSDSSHFNFVGNQEANHLFSDNLADVIVCDGFVGNIVLKEGEAFYNLLRKRNIKDKFFDKFNFENFGGSTILGASGIVVIGHGISSPKAIMNMIFHTRDMVKADLVEEIIKEIK